jgi:hypothetical protein
MNAPKHTPGPWQANPFDPERRTRGIWGGAPSPHLTYIATVGAVLHGTRIDEETEANARLIAAAPAMLDALQTLQRWIIPGTAAVFSEELVSDLGTVIKAAVNKATGDAS